MSTERFKIEGSKREGTGKGIARALRREGQLPAVIYGDKKEPVSIALDSNELHKEYYKGRLFTTVCEITIDGDKHVVLPRDAQLHPVSDNVLHVDFLRVTKKTKIPVEIPVHFINEDVCPGLRDDGILNVIRYYVEVYCSALEIPEGVEVDLAEFELNDTIKSDAIKLPDGVEFTISDRDFSIASIDIPREEPVEEDEDELAADEVPTVDEDEAGEDGESPEGGEEAENKE